MWLFGSTLDITFILHCLILVYCCQCCCFKSSMQKKWICKNLNSVYHKNANIEIDFLTLRSRSRRHSHRRYTRSRSHSHRRRSRSRSYTPEYRRRRSRSHSPMSNRRRHTGSRVSSINIDFEKIVQEQKLV